MIPVLFNVLPNPSFIAVITPVVVTPAASVRSTTGIPPISPVRSAARSSAINVWIFVFITRTIITIIPIASPSIILVDSLIFGYLFTNLSSTRSLCQRAVIYLTMLLYEKKDINSIDAFINTYVLFLCILYNFSYTVMKFSKSFHFHFNMIFFCQSILFQQLFYFIF